ncbi:MULTISPECIES: hypothetical protein [Lysobacter]|uniref:Uncharacterized protein n=1 Tax=Lysobacter yananisis TaxID=1003114 RepID=A0ABY9PC27_9GAMM|nr:MULTISPECIES: hypothetical protein [Lysobacter]QQQ01302.1 hypothetical protein JHW41_25240 [Lysobacter enzymogenes]WMT04441.1 hypothetical protein RDV84_06325 [Lysobacter yananisis]
MKNHSLSICAGVLAMAMAPAALAQVSASKAELAQAAVGESFTIGHTEYRIAPSAVVTKPAEASTEAGRELVPGDYVVAVPAAAVASARSARSLSVGGENLGAAVSGSGDTVIVAPELNVYFSHPGVVDQLVKQTGGTLLYSSAVGGNATIGYASVSQAMQARQLIQGQAGVKEVNPRLVEQRRVPW